MNERIARLRQEYTLKTLREEDVPQNPLALFETWFTEAERAELLEPNAMALATVDAIGQPSVRFVLLKGCDERGLVFYTNYESRKARDLDQNPRASACFWWGPLERQVRVEGQVEKVAAADSDEYFASRPRAAQIGAWASDQSRVLPDRDTLDRKAAEFAERFADGDVPRPELWGGYRLKPTLVEFWQGRQDRLHDRLRYRAGPNRGWLLERLAP